MKKVKLKNQSFASRHHRWWSAGFTLLELMITLSVASLLVVAATPTFRETIQESRMRAAVTNLEGALNLARMEAMRRNVSVTVCSVADPQAASPQDCKDDDSGWDTGWIVFADRNVDLDFDANDELIRVFPAPEAGLSVLQNGPQDHAQFKPTGTSHNAASSFLICDERGIGKARSLALSFIGRVQSQAPETEFSATDCPGA